MTREYLTGNLFHFSLTSFMYRNFETKPCTKQSLNKLKSSLLWQP